MSDDMDELDAITDEARRAGEQVGNMTLDILRAMNVAIAEMGDISQEAQDIVVATQLISILAVLDGYMEAAGDRLCLKTARLIQTLLTLEASNITTNAGVSTLAAIFTPLPKFGPLN